MNKKREYKIVGGYIEGKVRYKTINGEPYFAARDVELLLGRKGFSNDTREICRGERVYRTFFNPGRGRPSYLRVINVGEVMRLIAKCNTPKAKELSDYLFQVIMPAGLKYHPLPFEIVDTFEIVDKTPPLMPIHYRKECKENARVAL